MSVPVKPHLKDISIFGKIMHINFINVTLGLLNYAHKDALRDHDPYVGNFVILLANNWLLIKLRLGRMSI